RRVVSGPPPPLSSVGMSNWSPDRCGGTSPIPGDFSSCSLWPIERPFDSLAPYWKTLETSVTAHLRVHRRPAQPAQCSGSGTWEGIGSGRPRVLRPVVSGWSAPTRGMSPAPAAHDTEWGSAFLISCRPRSESHTLSHDG